MRCRNLSEINWHRLVFARQSLKEFEQYKTSNTAGELLGARLNILLTYCNLGIFRFGFFWVRWAVNFSILSEIRRQRYLQNIVKCIRKKFDFVDEGVICAGNLHWIFDSI